MWHAYGNANGDAYIHPDGDRDGYFDGNTNGDSRHISDTNGDSRRISDAYGDSRSISDTNGDSHRNGDCYGYGNSNGDGNCDHITAAFTDAAASSDTAAPTVRVVDLLISLGTRERTSRVP
jgi:hypothetical protein